MQWRNVVIKNNNDTIDTDRRVRFEFCAYVICQALAKSVAMARIDGQENQPQSQCNFLRWCQTANKCTHYTAAAAAVASVI